MNIDIDAHTDAFTLHVYNSIDEDIRNTFTPRQVHAIETAIRANKPYQKHPFDVRGVIPLYFLKLYFVVLMGRDKRSATKNREAKRRVRTAISSALLSFYLLSCMLIPVLLMLLYLIKSFAGIDLLPTIHLWDLLPSLYGRNRFTGF